MDDGGHALRCGRPQLGIEVGGVVDHVRSSQSRPAGNERDGGRVALAPPRGWIMSNTRYVPPRVSVATADPDPDIVVRC